MASIVPEKKMSLKDKLRALDAIATKTNKQFGKTIMGRIGKTPEIMDKLTIKFLPTPSAQLNRDLGGGIPRARCTIITGDPDSGKTSFLLETIAVNMKDPDFTAGWLESEASLEKGYICDTFGIDPDRFFFIPLDIKIGTEKTLDIVEGLIATGAVDMFCINSLRCLVPDKEREKDMSSETVASQARMNAKMMRKWTGLIAQYETAFCVVQHLTTAIGVMYGDPKVLAGGEAYRYWAAVILRLTKHSIQASDPIEKDEGLKIGYIVKKNHCTPGAKRQYCKGEYFIRYGEGTDEVAPSISVGIEAGVLERHGAFLWWMEDGKDEPKHKFKSKADFVATMKSNEAMWNEYYALLTNSIPQENLSDAEIAEIEAEEAKLQEKAEATEALIDDIAKESA